MALHKEPERICRELEEVEGIAVSLVNQASLLAYNRKQPRDAMPLAEEAHRLAREHGYTALSERRKRGLDAIRARLQ